MNDAFSVWIIVAGVIFLVLALTGFYLWWQDRMVIFADTLDLMLTCGSPFVVLTIISIMREEKVSGEVFVWGAWGLLLVIGALVANKWEWKKLWVALPARLLAMVLVVMVFFLARKYLSKFLKNKTE
jgi:hypothetical protein